MMRVKNHRGLFTVLYCCILLLFHYSLLSASEPKAFDSAAIDKAISEFEKDHGRCSAVLMESATGRIAYVHDRELSFQRRFPPGSLAKPWTAAVLCEDSAFSPSAEIICRGQFYPADINRFSPDDERRFNLSHDTETGRFFFPCSLVKGHGSVCMQEALIHSCNFYFLSAAQTDSFYEKLVQLWHLDDSLLSMPDAGNSLSSSGLSKFQRISSAIGEGRGVLVSPLKAAENYSALFEDTPLLEPFEGKGSSTVRHDLLVSQKTRQIIKSALVMTKEKGTLHHLKVPSAKIILLAGKTGTSTDLKDKKNHHGWNALWIETGGTRYVLVSFVLKGSGAKEAADLSGRILSAL